MKRYRRRSQRSPLALEKKTITNVIGFSLLGVAILLAISNFTKTGALLQLKDYAFKAFGIWMVLVSPLIILIALPLVSVKNRFTKNNVVLGLSALILSLSGLSGAFSQKTAGIVGASLWATAKSTITTPGAFIILLLATLISIVITAVCTARFWLV